MHALQRSPKSLSCMIKILEAECNHFLFVHLFDMTAKSPSEAQLAPAKLSNDALKGLMPGEQVREKSAAAYDLLCFKTRYVLMFFFPNYPGLFQRSQSA